MQLADDGTRRMTTRSGQPYKKEGMAAEQFEKMFQFLLEDRKLRDQEFAPERDRLENERRTRERVLPPGRKESCRRGGKSPAAGEERVLPPGRRESCRRGGKSPAAGEERVLPPGRKESCRRGGKSPAAGEERVLPPGREESCRRGGESPAAGEERVLPPGRKESCRRGGKSPAAGEERVLPPGRKESCRRGGESPAPGRERARAALQEGKSEGVYVTQGEAYARECMCGKAGGQRRDRSKRVHGVKTVEKN